jgi:hypothetical protein
VYFFIIIDKVMGEGLADASRELRGSKRLHLEKAKKLKC